jgi:hypothetical protein
MDIYVVMSDGPSRGGRVVYLDSDKEKTMKWLSSQIQWCPDGYVLSWTCGSSDANRMLVWDDADNPRTTWSPREQLFRQV